MSQDPNIKTTQPIARAHSNNNGCSTEALSVIREEQGSPTSSSMHLASSKSTGNDCKKCFCKKHDEAGHRLNSEEFERILNEKEADLRAEYDKILLKEMAAMKERFNYILINEQTRTSYMLREAHRERQEKIAVLQSQLQCKNLAALMYVMCTEKKRSKLEKLRLVKEYTNYIRILQDILTEGQELILHLSRGYKTAARVDNEWREKMKKVVSEFMSFIYNFAGGNPETNQFFIDLPKLLKTHTPIEDNPSEDPCDGCDEDADYYEMEIPEKKCWWEQLEDARRPFIMFGDMSEFKPSQRRDTLRSVKAAKTAPRKWKKYVFNDMFFESSCNNLDSIKDLYLTRIASPTKWECNQVPIIDNSSKQSISTPIPRRPTGQSIDIRGNMGSLLKIITATNTVVTPAKIELLGARDSMEITSATKLRERAASLKAPDTKEEAKGVVLDIGKKRASVFDPHLMTREEEATASTTAHTATEKEKEDEKEREDDESMSALGSVHNDSLQVISTHVPDMDHKINYERICPMEHCRRLQVDSFMRSLPPYMRANPFTHFEQTFDLYETCTPEQLKILKERIEAKKRKETAENIETPLTEWTQTGVGVQTSDIDFTIPPCTCHESNPSPVSSNFVFDFKDLLPVKEAMDAIHRECFFDDGIEFNRFKVLGQESKSHAQKEEPTEKFKEIRYDEIKKILKKHPSLLDIFQANVK